MHHEEPIEEKKEPKVEGDMIKLGPNQIGTEHNFVMEREKDGQLVARCTKCPHGYPLGPNSDVREGHIYIDNEFVI